MVEIRVRLGWKPIPTPVRHQNLENEPEKRIKAINEKMTEYADGDVFKTLPVLIYSYTKKPVKPDIYALFTILVVVILLLLVLSNVVSRRGERKEKRAK